MVFNLEMCLINCMINMSNGYTYHTIYIVIVSTFIFFELIFGKV